MWVTIIQPCESCVPIGNKGSSKRGKGKVMVWKEISVPMLVTGVMTHQVFVNNSQARIHIEKLACKIAYTIIFLMEKSWLKIEIRYCCDRQMHKQTNIGSHNEICKFLNRVLRSDCLEVFFNLQVNMSILIVLLCQGQSFFWCVGEP